MGYGPIGSWVAEAISANASCFSLAALCVRDRQIEEVRSKHSRETLIATDVEEFLSADLDVVVEAAGQRAVIETAHRILAHGCDLQILSTGALARVGLREELREAALRSNVQIHIPAGALAGFRGLMTLRQCGLTSVHYTSTKPSHAWANTPAATRFDLEHIDHAEVIFEGNAADAASQFPANANLAAAVALAGLGFEDTRVTLIADPSTELNTGQVEAISPIATMVVTMAGRPFAANPKTSRITGMSVLAALENSHSAICFI